jgi:hypothetical protein
MRLFILVLPFIGVVAAAVAWAARVPGPRVPTRIVNIILRGLGIYLLLSGVVLVILGIGKDGRRPSCRMGGVGERCLRRRALGLAGRNSACAQGPPATAVRSPGNRSSSRLMSG